MSISLKKAKMADLINYRLRVIIQDGREFAGEMLSFDKYMNLVLADTEEFRITKKSGEEIKRTLGLIILRGETVVSVTVEAPPATTLKSNPASSIPTGPGAIRPITRTSGLTAPVKGTASTAGPSFGR